MELTRVMRVHVKKGVSSAPATMLYGFSKSPVVDFGGVPDV